MIFSLNSALIGPASERPDPHDPTIPRNGSTPPTYICIDTLDVFQDVGSSWLLVGTLAFSGLAADGSGGIVVSGAVRSGAGGTFSRFNGALEILANEADYSNGQPPLMISQQGTLDVSDGWMQQSYSDRYIDRAGLPVGNPVFEVSARDASTGSSPIPATEPVFRTTSDLNKSVTTYADGSAEADGDVIVHGKIRTGASVPHTLGAYNGKSVPIYDAGGTLLGYMPLYA